MNAAFEPRRPKPLYDLLLQLYRSNDDLYTFLENYDYARASDLINSLPSANVSRSTFVMHAVQQLQAHGIDTEPLFNSLADRFPAARDSIAAAKTNYFSATRTAPDPLEDTTPRVAPLGPDPPDLRLTIEKIMGGRPTFLDVAYLAVGYERSKSVAKLLMRFVTGWYAGTAFLVTPDTLLTAHHNLWANETGRADQVQVIFDFERSLEGPDKDVSVYDANPERFAGDAEADWAILKLDSPQLKRPVAPLANRPITKGDRVAIIQHPGGQPKQVAFHNNLVTFADDRRIQYVVDTMPGSSGSPVFDAEWKVGAVHTRGGHLPEPGNDTVYRNQGTPIHRARAGMLERGITI
jgi:V8-like Glu-specific endopeptidase